MCLCVVAINCYLPPWPPWESKHFLGGFWHLSQLKFEEISPKKPRMQIWLKLAPLAVPPITRPPDPPGSQIFCGRFLAPISAQVWKFFAKIAKHVDFKKTAPPPPRLLAPLAHVGVKIFFGRFLASISAQVWRNITKIAKNVDFKKTGPPDYYPPWPPWES